VDCQRIAETLPDTHPAKVALGAKLKEFERIT
jgi:hypothetical protein